MWLTQGCRQHNNKHKSCSTRSSQVLNILTKKKNDLWSPFILENSCKWKVCSILYVLGGLTSCVFQWGHYPVLCTTFCTLSHYPIYSYIGHYAKNLLLLIGMTVVGLSVISAVITKRQLELKVLVLRSRHMVLSGPAALLMFIRFRAVYMLCTAKELTVESLASHFVSRLLLDGWC